MPRWDIPSCDGGLSIWWTQGYHQKGLGWEKWYKRKNEVREISIETETNDVIHRDITYNESEKNLDT